MSDEQKSSSSSAAAPVAAAPAVSNKQKGEDRSGGRARLVERCAASLCSRRFVAFCLASLALSASCWRQKRVGLATREMYAPHLTSPHLHFRYTVTQTRLSRSILLFSLCRPSILSPLPPPLLPNLRVGRIRMLPIST